MSILFNYLEWDFKKYLESLQSKTRQCNFKKASCPTFFALALMFLSPLVFSSSLNPGKLTIAVASNFYPTAVELKKMFNKQHPEVDITLEKGASGDLFDHIVKGKAIDVFLSADGNHPATLERLDRIEPGSLKTFAFGRIAFLHKLEEQHEDHGHGHGEETISVKELGDFIIENKDPDIYIPNSQGSPYGERVEALLKAAGVYYSLNATERLQIEDSSHDVWLNSKNKTEVFALLPASLVFHGEDDHSKDIHDVKHPYPEKDQVSLLEDTEFRHLKQQMVILKNSTNKPAAKAFTEFMLSSGTQSYIADHGYYPANHSNKCNLVNSSGAASYFSSIPYLGVGILSAVISTTLLPAWTNRGYCRF
ncbi:hypothetical protein GZ77_24630 [Endozoicomonas montiporae]|uniref:Molybdate ABC transporter substrate-binding protein n=2 Tax=Endozoicomonas montiporae TaxID=1027273 RepID=A0A081MZS6_9GAMM|nr:hypothetical protein GZ77_24630 [Endozoicomonas montiporae]